MGSKRSLLRRVRALEEEAIGTVFDMYYPLIYRYIYHHVRHQPTAEDLTGEVFTRMLEQLVKGGGPDRNLKAWLYRVAYNLIVDNSRRQVHRDHEPLPEQVLSVERKVDEQVHQNLLKERAQAALDTLTPKQRTVIVLKFLEGWSNREVSRVMQTSVGAVKALQHRGLASMQRYMQRSEAQNE
jgi:RNA polymerase sigma-70 factor (ECF subfamily)